MTDEQINIAISKIHKGFKDFDRLLWCNEENCQPWEGRKLHGATSEENIWHPVLDYCNDLNAMHEAELLLAKDSIFKNYEAMLDKVVPMNDRWIFATARQRAEAFLKTIGKWNE